MTRPFPGLNSKPTMPVKSGVEKSPPAWHMGLDRTDFRSGASHTRDLRPAPRLSARAPEPVRHFALRQDHLVVEVNEPPAESTLVQQLELDPVVRWEGAIPGPDEDGSEEQVNFVNERSL